jgi:SsrA-binding protein
MSHIAENRRARHEYAIEERFEAGMVLAGWEIKAIRAGQVQLTDGYVLIRDGELFLIGCRINALRSASTHVHPEADRTKKLLMHKEEIRRLVGKVEQKGFTLVPTEPALQGRPGEGRDRAGQGQVPARQTRHRKETRLGARTRAPDAPQGVVEVVGLNDSQANARSSACARSACKSDTDSRPMEKRTRGPCRS